MAERKTFPMSAFVALMTGEGKSGQQANINEMCAFMTGKEIDKENQLFAESVAKAFVLDANPELAGKDPEEMAKIGSSVSVTVLPAEYLKEVNSLFKSLASMKETINSQKDKIAALEKDLSATKSQLAEAKGYKAKYESLEKDGEQMINTAKSKIEDMNVKVDELLKKIEEVKKHGVVTAAPGAEGAAAAPAADQPTDSPGEVSADFGFGTDSSEDSFGF